jgi:hypothetical protein
MKKKEIPTIIIILMSTIIVSTFLILPLDFTGHGRQVSAESTGLLMPQTSEQFENKTTLKVFTDSLRGLVSKSTELTGKYQIELGKWTKNENDNSTMISITDRYLSLFKELEKEATELAVPSGQENIKESFINSISSEAASYEHFKNYLMTGNRTEDELSIDDLSLAFQYEQVYATFLLKNR